MTVGVCYVAFGDKAVAECQMSIAALRRVSQFPIATISQYPIEGAKHVPFDDPRWGARFAKLNLDTLSPFDDTLYIDADTRPRQDLTLLLTPLADGYDMVIAPSINQGDKALWHVDAHEREATLDAFGYTPIQLQAGVFAFRKNEATAALFKSWRMEWSKMGATQDQAALLRALQCSPVRLWLLSAALSDILVAHVWGRLH